MTPTAALIRSKRRCSMMITDEHVELATVERMRDMLENVHDDYEVTHAYALFTTILCWVMQRIRTDGKSQTDLRARSVLDTLEKEPISDQPWQICTKGADDQQRVQGFPRCDLFPKFDGLTAATFLTALRNATAHGDARNIRPVNEGDILVGYEFRCSGCRESKRGRATWCGKIVLKRRDMQRIGIALADRFCKAIEDHRVGFKDVAQSIREEA